MSPTRSVSLPLTFIRQGASSVVESVSVARSCESREAEEEAEEDVLLDFPELLVFSDFDALPDLPHGAELLVFSDFDVLPDLPHGAELLVFSDFDALPDLPHGADSEPWLLEDLAEVPVEALLPPALLFPDLLAEEDVLNKSRNKDMLQFPDLLVFLPDLPHGSGSDFEPLLFEDLAGFSEQGSCSVDGIKLGLLNGSLHGAKLGLLDGLLKGHGVGFLIQIVGDGVAGGKGGTFVGFSSSLGHFGEDLLDFAEDEEVLLDFPELLVFSAFLCVRALGRMEEGQREGRSEERSLG